MTRSSILSLFYLCSIAALAVEGFQVGNTVRLSRGVSLRAETTGDVPLVDPPKAVIKERVPEPKAVVKKKVPEPKAVVKEIVPEPKAVVKKKVPEPKAVVKEIAPEPKVEVPVAAATAVATNPVAVAETPAGTMDEGIFEFNKKLIDTVYDIICFLYPVKGNERDFARFFVLETVARVPYFAYLSCLHLQETFGVRYDSMSDRMRTHYAEADNELHHLLIQESLGGNSNPVDRLLAQTMAFFYYWYVIGIYTWNDAAAYHLSELIEDHAYNTYSNFLANHGDFLKSRPVPEVARRYYEQDNPFLFDLFCTVKDQPNIPYSQRRPKLETLYDVFVCIRDDEKEHWKTLCNLVQYDEMNAIPAKDVKSTEPLHTPTN